MPSVFLSYSTKDHHFAELATIKLGEAGVDVWRDVYGIRAGTNWRGEIETAIDASQIVIVALSPNSCESPYVTFEWAYAIGRGKAIIPLKIFECKMHPRLEPIQYLDFTLPNTQPWQILIERIEDVDVVDPSTEPQPPSPLVSEVQKTENDTFAEAIQAYLESKGFQMMSFDRIRTRISSKLTDANINEIIIENRNRFAHATLKGGIPGIKRIIP